MNYIMFIESKEFLNKIVVSDSTICAGKHMRVVSSVKIPLCIKPTVLNIMLM